MHSYVKSSVAPFRASWWLKIIVGLAFIAVAIGLGWSLVTFDLWPYAIGGVMIGVVIGLAYWLGNLIFNG